MNSNNRNAKSAKGQKVPMTNGKYGDGAPYAKEQGERKVSDMAMKAHIVIAPDIKSGKMFVNRMGWREERAAIISDADHLRGYGLDPGEDVWVVMDVDAEFLTALQASASQFKSGESVNIRLVQL